MTDPAITHTTATGTLLEGVDRNHNSADTLRQIGWRWSARMASWYVPRSRGRGPSEHLIARTIQALDEAGTPAQAHLEQDHLQPCVDGRSTPAEIEHRAEATAVADAARSEGPAVARRIAALEAQRRKITRSIQGYRSHLGDQVPPATGDQLTMLKGELADVDEDLAHWTRVRTLQVAAGTAIALTRDDVARGDLVEYRGRWLPVLRVNPKSVSVQGTADGSWTETIPFHQINGHQPKQA